MVNEASEGQRQERTWWRLPAMLMCKPFENISKGTKDKPNHLKSMFVLSRVSLGIAAAEQLYQVARMMKRNRERVVLDPFSNIQMCKIKWLLSVNPRCKCLVVFFSLVFQSLFCFLSLLSPFPFFPCSLILTLALTPPCVDPNTRRRVGIYTLVFHCFFSVPHHTHRTPNTHTHTPNTTTTQHQHQHNITQRQTQRDRDEERQR